MKTHIQNLFIMLALLAGINQAAAQGTAFSYQGKLNDGANPASGSYDLRFTLYDAGTNGTVFGSLTNTAAGISNGLFLATLDFGSVFNGTNYWLEIAARTNGGGAFTTLSPRQSILPTPYAIYSANAGSAATATTANTANSVSAANISGTVQLAQLPGTILTNNQNGVNLTGTFTGNGASLTNLNAVAKTGDTMTGTLNLPANGLVAGTRQLVLSGGNVGVGTTSPSAKLHVGGGTRFTVADIGSIFLQSGTGFNGRARDWKIYSSMDDPGGDLAFRDMGFDNLNNGMAADALVIQAITGNVGIGTNNPQSTLHVNGTVTATGIIKAIGGLIIENRTSDPAVPASGQIWLRTDLP